MNNKIKISVVMAYYNRRQLLLNTLLTISKSSKINEIEVIITDDGSDVAEMITDLPKMFNFPITVIRVEPQDKWYTNPCIPYNMAIKRAKGDFIVLQNPEVLHTADILADIETRVNDSNYVVYGVYAVNPETTNKFHSLDYNSSNIFNNLTQIITPLLPHNAFNSIQTGWYNHSIYRPAKFHFLSAISKTNMNKLNGFDERYALGVDRDDDEFLYRIERNKLKVVFVDNLIGVHQFHPPVNYQRPNTGELRQRNLDVYNRFTTKETNWSLFSVDLFKVSVIIPFFNRIQWVVESVKSVLNQTHKNTEIILIDDASTDNIDPIKLLLNQNPNVFFYPLKTNSGAAVARNLGIEKATGDYIAFLDSDDEFLPNKIETQLKFMINEDYDASHTSYYVYTEGGIEHHNSGAYNMKLPEIISNSNIATPSLMVKRSFIMSNNIRFPDYRISEDICFFIRICHHTIIRGLNICLTKVRSHNERAFIVPKKALIGMTTILRFVLNEDYTLHEFNEIINLCRSINILAIRYANSSSDYMDDRFDLDKQELQKLIIQIEYEKKLLEIEQNKTISLLKDEVIRLNKSKIELERKLLKLPIEPTTKLVTMVNNPNYNINSIAPTPTINKRHPSVRFTRKTS